MRRCFETDLRASPQPVRSTEPTISRVQELDLTFSPAGDHSTAAAGAAPIRTTTAVSLPYDVIFNILSRIPARFLRRLPCVCRDWRALTSDPAFLAAHKSRQPNLLVVVDTGCFRRKRQCDLRLRDLSGNVVRVIEGVGGFDILPTTSLDALVCVIDGPRGVHAVDLTTGEVLSTKPGLEVTKKHHDFVRCQYETFGIGRTASSGEYKVVWLVQADTCQVLTLGGDDTRWRRTYTSNKYYLDRYCPPVTIDGVMYFLTQGTSGTLLCFDLENELWKDDPIKGPSEVVGVRMWSTESVYLTELNGFLCVVQDEDDESSTNVWILDEIDKSNWTKAYTIPKVTFGCGPMAILGCHYMPLRVMHGGKKLLVECAFRYMQGSSSSFGLYDPDTKTCTNIMPAPDYLPGKIVLCNLHLEHLPSVKS